MTFLTSEHPYNISGETAMAKLKASILKRPLLGVKLQANSSEHEPDIMVQLNINKRTTAYGDPDYSKDLNDKDLPASGAPGSCWDWGGKS